jgi:hypothetical protein
MERNSKRRRIPIRTTNSEANDPIADQIGTYSHTAAVCCELADEMEVDGFTGNFRDRFAKVLPRLFLLSVMERRPRS